jgi:hypothetical protein
MIWQWCPGQGRLFHEFTDGKGETDLFGETRGITGFGECGLHLLVLNERRD